MAKKKATGKPSTSTAAVAARARRHKPGAVDPEPDGPAIGPVDTRTDTAFEPQQVPRPARPVTPVNETAARLASGPTAGTGEEEPLEVETGFPKKVRAIKMGYLRHSRRRAGDVFVIYNSKEFSPAWMEYAGSNDPEKITSGQDELNRQRRESLEDQLAKKKAGTGDTNVLGVA